MEQPHVERWLAEYGRAWERKDVDAFVSLFSEGVRYRWTPFEEPREGRAALGRSIRAAVRRQEEIRFTATVLGVVGSRGLAHWQCSFRRPGGGRQVHLDGVFLMEFDEDGRCAVFREWWHSDE